MKLIVGLGNPGEEYRSTRHNVGFMVVDRMANDTKGEWEAKFDGLIIKDGETVLLKPQTFMNDSGKAVRQAANFFKIDPSEIVVVHDDLDIRLGEYKITLGVGPKLHNGLISIEKELGRSDFVRSRVGVDNRSFENRRPGDKYVLENFTEEEKQKLEEVISRLLKESCLNG